MIPMIQIINDIQNKVKEQEEVQAQLLLNQAEISLKQQEHDEVLAALLLQSVKNE